MAESKAEWQARELSLGQTGKVLHHIPTFLGEPVVDEATKEAAIQYISRRYPKVAQFFRASDEFMEQYRSYMAIAEVAAADSHREEALELAKKALHAANVSRANDHTRAEDNLRGDIKTITDRKLARYVYDVSMDRMRDFGDVGGLGGLPEEMKEDAIGSHLTD